jgi:hypothetical protein
MYSLNVVLYIEEYSNLEKGDVHTIGYIDARVAVKAIDSSIADRGIGRKVLCIIFIITAQ